MKNKNYGQGLIRIVVGLLFFLIGIIKLTNPSGIIDGLSALGLPAPAFFGWLMLLVEIVFGLSVLLGWKVRYTVWPLVVIIIAAILIVWLPRAFDIPSISTFFLHLLALASLISLFLHGPGAWSIGK